MACDTRLKSRQTISERKEEVKKAISALDKLIASGKVNVRVGTEGLGKGAVAFKGWADVERDGVSDACAFRQLMVTGSALTKAKIAQAQQMSGTSINRQVIGQGVHSHDGGATWHKGH